MSEEVRNLAAGDGVSSETFSTGGVVGWMSKWLIWVVTEI